MTSSSTQATRASSDEELASRIRASTNSSSVVSTVLTTDERVIARVTDGIYRQPGSALRELISNAYDADASRVVIKTDAPRFERIIIEDDGHGMTPDVLAHLLHHIGGSAKRNDAGKDLGITAPNDPTKSPGGRRLIGKIGIGLFSVSQLTHSFQIITKIKNDPYRTIATIALKQYTDDEVLKKNGKAEFESGKVNIWREKASDHSSHGTTIVLTSIRPQARDTLRSREIWAIIEQNEALATEEERQAITPPKFHIGRVDGDGQLLKKTSGKFSSLPWENSDSPNEAFKKLVQCVWDEVGETPNPKLEDIFDYYLRMVWQLSLAIPLPYVDGHIFDLKPTEQFEIFALSNLPKGNARQLEAAPNRPIRNLMDLSTTDSMSRDFEVFVDDLKLARPIKFQNLPFSNHALRKHLVFLGKCREEFPKVPKAISGGTLSFEAYLFWTPKIAPTEHQGSLIRIHGASGTLFDPTFMRYQVSEQTRLRQITCEIFVAEGLDSALNIDRESFNNAHPHAVYITKWLHGALRQLASAQKRLASEVRESNRDESREQTVSEIQQVAQKVWEEESGDPASRPPAVEISSAGKKSKPTNDAYVFERSAVVPEQSGRKSARSKTQESIVEEKLKAIAQVLASFGLLDGLAKRKQEKLLKAIYRIIDAADE